ncbi:unnamed protein product [Linum trigynum]|uniref:Uncharacterized protein n=1 Tax=Linum trigynum TaxID=586398 RepID=A0AAV2DB39_9ROSI
MEPQCMYEVLQMARFWPSSVLSRSLIVESGCSGSRISRPHTVVGHSAGLRDYYNCLRPGSWHVLEV